jgi:general L-amino acid transport system permease protein
MSAPRSTGTLPDPPGGYGPAWGGPALGPSPPPPPRPAARLVTAFANPAQAALTFLLAALLAWAGWSVWGWAVTHAVWHADAAACDALGGQGACWGVVPEKLRAMLFGRYPPAQQWRAGAATAVLLALVGLSAWPRCWRAALLVPLWLLGLLLALALMGGGVAGLPAVPTRDWGGLPLTLLLTIAGLIAAFPLAVLLALARRSPWPAARTLSRLYVELVRGVPLISVLFMASFLLPLLLPASWQADVLLRVFVALALFVAAYLSEVIRGGLQAVPQGQLAAARALGLSRWQQQRLVVLPQALRAVLPSIVNVAIGVLKDTSLVTVVSLYDLTGALQLALGGDPVWRPYYLEGYLFVALLYWAMCFGLSRYGRWMERHWR